MGFVVRPFGALFFGRIGDLVGRYIRLRMKESPIFAQIKSACMTSARPAALTLRVRRG